MNKEKLQEIVEKSNGGKMKIKNNTIYSLPTRELERQFLIQAEKQGIRWYTGHSATEKSYWREYEGVYCISVTSQGLEYNGLSYYLMYRETPIVEWSPDFTKDDMEDGMVFLTRKGKKKVWSRNFINLYNNDLTSTQSKSADIKEVYVIPTETVWTRKPKTYRVKQELTEEQAKKLGLEFCEEVVNER